MKDLGLARLDSSWAAKRSPLVGKWKVVPSASGSLIQGVERRRSLMSVSWVSMGRGMNMFMRWRALARKVVVFIRRGAVLRRQRVVIDEGIRRASSWAIIPPIEMPRMWRFRFGFEEEGGAGGDSRSEGDFCCSEIHPTC